VLFEYVHGCCKQSLTVQRIPACYISQQKAQADLLFP
jgi:hypothetical protein